MGRKVQKQIGMIGVLGVLAITLVGAAPALATVHIVNQTGTTFVPDNLEVAIGDTVRWVYSGGSHTVTNGTGASDPQAGVLFDAPLNGANPTFEYVFDGPTGVYSYFCRPHETLGMTGQVVVAAETPVEDPPLITEYTTWGEVKDIFRDDD